MMELTVMVPARNEEACLEACLRSLTAQSEPGFELGRHWELIVVDDGSTDATHSIAESFAGVTVMNAPPLESKLGRKGMTGKNNALWAAAQQAKGKWLLFTDADTRHASGSLGRAMREAEKYEASLLSYSPKQIATGFWQRALMPLIFSELSIAYPPKKVSDPASRIAAANGQFLLIDRETYFAVGGHQAVGDKVLEDVELAWKVKASRRRLRFRYGGEALETQMYRTLPAMIEGWTKNLAILFLQPLALAGFRLIDFGLLLSLPVLMIVLPQHLLLLWWQWAALGLLWIRVLWRYLARVRKSEFPWIDCVLSIAALPMLAWLLWRSWMQVKLKHEVSWKGRVYKA
ncbi:glycosyltransferase [Terriglobus albidus]|uniref:glycosyltransferase n=1 Tax=Terriglobus albidus TaxID=1592106 RepID=UPI0021DF96F4|nr:glycosyltransferase [Terriglobus albidus]